MSKAGELFQMMLDVDFQRNMELWIWLEDSIEIASGEGMV